MEYFFLFKIIEFVLMVDFVLQEFEEDVYFIDDYD